MNYSFKKYPVFMALSFVSFLLTACGSNDEADDDLSTPSVSSVQVSYSVSLSDTWYKFFNVELSYDTFSGNTSVESLDMDKNMNITYNFSETPKKIGLKIVAKPKANHPDVEDGVTYPINKEINFKVVGVASNGSGSVFLFNKPRTTIKSTGGDALRNSLNKEHVLYDQSYTIPQK